MTDFMAKNAGVLITIPFIIIIGIALLGVLFPVIVNAILFGIMKLVPDRKGYCSMRFGCDHVGTKECRPIQNIRDFNCKYCKG